MNIMRNSIFSFLLSLCISSCNTPKDKEKKCTAQSIKINICNEPQTLDPRKARSLNDVNLTKTLMEGMTRLGKDGKVELALAEKIAISEDLQTYTIFLRQAQWSNGDPITAADFLYSWKQSLSPTFPSSNAFQLYIIKNAEAIKRNQLPMSLLGVNSIDSHTIEIKLEHPAPYFLELLSLPIFFPIHAQRDREDATWAEKPTAFLNNGPFSLSDWRSKDCITVKKNPLYWNANNVKLEQIEMIMVGEDIALQMFENKELDWIGSPFSSLPTDAIEHLKKAKLFSTSLLFGTHWIRINTNSYPLHMEKLRKAFASAINRKDIVQHIVQGDQTPALSLLPPMNNFFPSCYFSDGDAKNSKALWQECVDQYDISLHSFPSITLLYSATERNHIIAQAIQSQWKNVFPFPIILEPAEPKIVFDRVARGDFQLAMGSWIADFEDPVNFLEIFKSKTNGTNNTGWEDPVYIELLTKSYIEKDEHQRLSLLQECEKVIMNAMPVIPIFYYTMNYLKKDCLQGVIINGLGSIDFRQAYLTQEEKK